MLVIKTFPLVNGSLKNQKLSLSDNLNEARETVIFCESVVSLKAANDVLTVISSAKPKNGLGPNEGASQRCISTRLVNLIITVYYEVDGAE